MDYTVDVFFYGSYINFAVLAEVGIDERPYQVAHVDGFRLRIGPLANLVAEPGARAYGIVMKLTHVELERLYVEHAQGVLGGTYLPEAVLATSTTGDSLPVLTYVSHDMEPGAADPDYVERIHGPARELGFPDDYLDSIRSNEVKAP